MRWNTPKSVGPKEGDKQTWQWFAFLPTELSEGQTVWLERYWITEIYYPRNGWCVVDKRPHEAREAQSENRGGV